VRCWRLWMSIFHSLPEPKSQHCCCHHLRDVIRFSFILRLIHALPEFDSLWLVVKNVRGYGEQFVRLRKGPTGEYMEFYKGSKSSCNAGYLALSWSYIRSSYHVGRRIDSPSLSYILFASNFLTTETNRLSKIETVHFR
jgi:hypothetical protein